jgi:uncharacterized membrane protein YeaQ/YmgE (transglycosylase-associated protein family)
LGANKTVRTTWTQIITNIKHTVGAICPIFIMIFPAVRNDFGWIYSTSEPPEGMNMSGESLVVILFVGVVAGWLAGQIVRGTGFGIVGDLVVGIIGAFIGDWLLPRLGVHLGVGIIAAIADATIGAILLLLVVRLVRGGGYWEGSGGGRRWGGWGSRRY